jgi:hypothetical protein
MDLRDDYFLEYLALAQMDALRERESRIFELRYGLADGYPQTLEQVGQEFGVTRERIRQIINRSLRKIRGKGRRYINIGNTKQPCAQLILYLEGIIRPDEVGHIGRFVDYLSNDLAYLPETCAIHLIACLMYPNREKEKLYRKEIKRHLRRRDRLKKDYERLENLFSHIIWPDSVGLLQQEEILTIKRERTVSLGNVGYAGDFFSKKMNRSVQYESYLERDFLLRLESFDDVVLYQEQPFVVPYERGGRLRNYYPDVFFVLKDERGVVVEIKPVFQMALRRNLVKWSALRKFCSQTGIGILITDGRYSIQQVQQHDVNPDFAKEVLSSLQRGALSWNEYREIRDRHDVSRNDFLALILKNRLFWDLQPFRLSLNER